MTTLNLQNLQMLATTLPREVRDSLGAVLRAQDDINRRIKQLLAASQVATTSVTLSDANPQALGTTAPGTGTEASRDDHVHAHGNLAGGSLHAVATDVTAGFMSAGDKALLVALYDVYFGAGSDGNLTLGASGTTFLSRDVYYDTLAWPVGSTAVIDTANYRLFVLNLDARNAPARAIHCNGNPGGNASGASQGAGGTARAVGIFNISGAGSNGGGGGASAGGTGVGTTAVTPIAGGSRSGTPNNGTGGGGTSGAGGLGGAVNAATTQVGIGYATALAYLYGGATLTGGNGGAGGGGGGGDGSPGGGGGGGGGGAGVAAVFARVLTTGVSTVASTISANGGNGGNADVASGGNRGGGGGGMAGGGGWVYAIIGQHVGPAVTGFFAADSGTGGAAASGTGASGLGGNGGGTMQAGRITVFRLDIGAGSVVEVLPGGGGGSGAAGIGPLGGAGLAATTARADLL